MRDLIGISSLLQHHLELGKSCMEDGPLTLSRMSISERREKLQAHINAWRNLQWSDCVHLFDPASIQHTRNYHATMGALVSI